MAGSEQIYPVTFEHKVKTRVLMTEIWFYYFHKPKSTDFKLFHKSDDQMKIDVKALSKLLCTHF